MSIRSRHFTPVYTDTQLLTQCGWKLKRKFLWWSYWISPRTGRMWCKSKALEITREWIAFGDL